MYLWHIPAVYKMHLIPESNYWELGIQTTSPNKQNYVFSFAISALHFCLLRERLVSRQSFCGAE